MPICSIRFVQVEPRLHIAMLARIQPHLLKERIWGGFLAGRLAVSGAILLAAMYAQLGDLDSLYDVRTCELCLRKSYADAANNYEFGKCTSMPE